MKVEMLRERRWASRRGTGILTIALLAALGSLCLSVASSGAASFQRPFKEVFGPVEQPTFEWPSLLAVDPNTGDLLVGDFSTQSIRRFHADGTPAPFSALGSNEIDGKRGAGGHTRAECETAPEPASCDETPQNSLEVDGRGQAQQIAVDSSGGPTNGNIYVTQKGQNLVDIFSSSGRYLGQLTATAERSLSGPCGVTVDSTGSVYVGGIRRPGEGEVAKFVPSANPPVNTDSTAALGVKDHEQVCRMSTGVGPSAGWLFAAAIGPAQLFKFGENIGEAIEFADGFGNVVTVDPTNGNPIFATGTSAEGAEFDGSLEKATERISRLLPQQGAKEIRDFAANSAGDIYVAIGPSDPRVFVYGTPAVVPTVTSEPASNVTGTKATLSGRVNPSGLAVSQCFIEWGPTTSYEHKDPCLGAIPTDSSPHPVHLNISGLTPNGATYHFRISATNVNGTETSEDQTFTTAQTVVTEAASGLGPTAATLNGIVRPEGEELSECFFEWEVASKAGYEHQTPCSPSAPGIPADFSPHAVTAALSGLQEGTAYRFRLVATTSQGTRRGELFFFATLGAPEITEVRALNATQSSATIEAKVDPNGFATTYRFEWGPTASYGNRIPLDLEPSLGAGTTPLRVSADLSGLSPATTYHYRIVASNTAKGRSVTASSDQKLETLNFCNLPDGRCLELVSPRVLGPVSAPGRFGAGVEIPYQAAEQPGSLAYVIENGLSDATKGAEVLYRGLRSGAGWESSVLNPPISARNEQLFGNSPGQFFALSNDLGCGVVFSSQPLTHDPVAQLIINAGGANLYQRRADGSYSLVTDLPPDPLKAFGGSAPQSQFHLVGLSKDCSTIVFGSEYHYAGLPGTGAERIYEWREGSGLRYLGWVPKVGGEQVAEAAVGSSNNIVSDDGSRVFFMAKRVIANNPAEVGKQGVFVREAGTATRDVSASTTAVANAGATFQGATPDGSRVYFTANAGLTAQSSSEGTDLYEYNLTTSTLKDLTISQEPGGAAVAKVVGIAANGSHAYFTSRAQLVPGQGKSRAQNEAVNTLSLYDTKGGILRFVATVSGRESWAALASGLNGGGPTKTTRVSSDGRYLLFETLGTVTGYQNGEVPQAYLYDANNASEPVVCVSCRQDGAPSVRPPEASGKSVESRPLQSGGKGNPLYEPQSLVVKGGEATVFFISRDRLAQGGVEGAANLYEWSHGQVFHIATEPAGFSAPSSPYELGFGGASADGGDLYFFDAAKLNWENPEGRYAVWDARVGGGFSEPPPPQTPCNPASEGSCQGPTPAIPISPTAGTAGFNGPGNAKPAGKAKKKKHAKRKHAKHRKKGHGRNGKQRHANRNGGAGK